jgi:serpin B
MRRGILIALGLGLALAIASVGCGIAKQPDLRGAAPGASSSPDPSELSGAAAVNAFGLDLMRSRMARRETNSDNVVVSPLSVHAALSMTLQGARGQTAAEMQRTLHLSGDANAAASTYSILLDALDGRSKDQTLSVANAIWVKKGLDVKRDFLNRNRVAFDSSVETLDFGRTDMVSVVNRWVAKQTRDMIPSIVTELDPHTVMLLANAVYFKAEWVQPFENELTQPRPFHVSATETVNVPTMHATVQLPVVEGAGFSATKLDYRGGDSAAYVILPAPERSLESVLGSLTAADFAALRARVDSAPATRTALALPKFDTTVGGGLNESLADMGMPTAFDRYKADFRDMATPPLGQNIWIGSVIHKARMKVDESGTEAAAATVVSMLCGAAPMQKQKPPIPFVCDRPFAIALIDTRSGAQLFLAAINDPRRP